MENSGVVFLRYLNKAEATGDQSVIRGFFWASVTADRSSVGSISRRGVGSGEGGGV